MKPFSLLFGKSASPRVRQIVSHMAHRWEVTGVLILRLSCDGNRRKPLCGESERDLEQSGHSTNATLLSANRLRLMETTPENVHLGDLLVCTVFVVFCPLRSDGGILSFIAIKVKLIYARRSERPGSERCQ